MARANWPDESVSALKPLMESEIATHADAMGTCVVAERTVPEITIDFSVTGPLSQPAIAVIANAHSATQATRNRDFLMMFCPFVFQDTTLRTCPNSCTARASRSYSASSLPFDSLVAGVALSLMNRLPMSELLIPYHSDPGKSGLLNCEVGAPEIRRVYHYVILVVLLENRCQANSTIPGIGVVCFVNQDKRCLITHELMWLRSRGIGHAGDTIDFSGWATAENRCAKAPPVGSLPPPTISDWALASNTLITPVTFSHDGRVAAISDRGVTKSHKVH